MKTITIYDVDGNVMYAREAPSRKSLIEQLIAEGKTLSRANLANANLTHIDLEKADFSYANLDGADLRGANANRANFHGASMRGVAASGMTGTYADFSGADMSRHPGNKNFSNLSGAVLTYAKFDLANLARADFTGCSMSSTSMVGVMAFRAKFRRATLHNTDWIDSETTGCDFTEAKMSPTLRISERHLPDRTWGAAIVGNNLSKADIGLGNDGFARDKRIGTIMKTTTWGTLTAGFYMAGMYLPLDAPVEFMKGTLGTGVSFVALAGAFAILHDYIEDFFKDGLFEWVSDLQVKIRQGIAKAVKSGKALHSLAVAFLSEKHADTVTKAIRDPEKSIFQRIKATICGEIEVVICDRKRIAEALARITDAQVGRFRKDADLVISRIGEHDDSPRALVLRKDGTSELIWNRPGIGQASLRWDKQGNQTTPSPTGNWTMTKGRREDLMDSFMRLIIHDNELHVVDFDSTTHAVRQGKDGSIVVVRRSNGRLSNPHGPIVYTPDDESLWKLDSLPDNETEQVCSQNLPTP